MVIHQLVLCASVNALFFNFYAAVIMHPKLITSPISVTAKENETAHFRCDFTASTLKYLTITEWYKNSVKLNNTSKFQITEKLHKTNEISLTLTISSISRDDEGGYRCHCYYNTTTLYQLHIYKNLTSQAGFARLEIEGMYIQLNLNHMLSLHNYFTDANANDHPSDIGMIIGVPLGLGFFIVTVVLILLYCKNQGKCIRYYMYV